MITKNWKLSSIFLFAFVIGLTSALSQSKSQLKQKKEKIQKELKKLNGLLGETRTNKRKSEIQLLILNKKIGVRKELIFAIDNEVLHIDKEIEKNLSSVDSLTLILEESKESYKNIIVKSYKTKSGKSRLMFLLSSETFFQAYRRVQYMKQYASFRKKQSIKISDLIL